MTYREYTHTGNPAGSLLSVNVRDVGSRCVVSKKNTAPETTFRLVLKYSSLHAILHAVCCTYNICPFVFIIICIC